MEKTWKADLTFLSLLPEELSDIKPEDFIEPNAKMRPGDHLLGSMTEGHKRFYTFLRRYLKEEDLLKVELKYNQDLNNPDSDNSKRLRRLSSLNTALREIFWVTISDHFDSWNRESVGVREGFQVVWTEGNPFQGLQSLLRGIMPAPEE